MDSTLHLERFIIGLAIGLMFFEVLLKDPLKKVARIVFLICLFILWISYLPHMTPVVSQSGFIKNDYFAIFFKKVFLTIGIISAFLEKSYHENKRYYIKMALFLFSILGMNLMVCAKHLIITYLGLELMSVALYGMLFHNIKDREELESGLKYFIISIVASALFLFGMVFVYVSCESLDYYRIQVYIKDNNYTNLFLIGLLLVFCALFLKVGIAPFHLWVPDVYQGAYPTTVGFIGSSIKTAIIATIIRLVYGVLSDLNHIWNPVFIGIGLLSILWGGICAIPQQNIKRLMGYSGIMNIGYVFAVLGVVGEKGLTAAIFYCLVYVLGVITIFGIYGNINTIQGLYQRSRILSVLIILCMMSLAGLPPLGGFVGKVLVFIEVIKASKNGIFIAIIFAISTILGLYFYFKPILSVYDNSNEDKKESFQRLPLIIVLLCILMLIYVGLAPEFLLNEITNAINSVTFYK